jgi:hypothetical protein
MRLINHQVRPTVDRLLVSGAYKTGSFVRSRQGRLYGGPENK